MKRPLLLFSAVAALLPMLAGAAPAAAAANPAHVRFVNLLPDYPSNVNFSVDGARYFSNVAYKTVSAYFRITAMNHDFVVRPVGSTSVVGETQQVLTGDAYYTLVVSGKQSDPRTGLYSDSPSETAGKVVIRFCHFAPEVPGVDVAAPTGQPIFFTNIGFTQCSQYATIDPGSYNLALWNTGKESTDPHPLFEADGVAVTGGTVNTIIGTGGEGSQPVTAIPVLDAVSAVRAPNGGASTGEGGLAGTGALQVGPLVVLIVLVLLAAVGLAARSRRPGI